MSPVSTSVEPAKAGQRSPVINDFTIQIATVNGSGSQTANLVLLRAIFQMGVPVAGKNFFPSNIAGLPTWFNIRASHRGYVAMRAAVDVFVAMNPETAKDDVMGLQPGTVVVYDEPLNLKALRGDLDFYPVPFDKIVADVTKEVKLRRLVRNMIYDGVLAELLAIDIDELKGALSKQLGGKAKAIQLNGAALDAGQAYARTTFTIRHPFRVQRLNKTDGMVLVEGNDAAAMGCLMAGVTVVAWYPITPSSSLPEALIKYLKKYRMDKTTGKATFAVVQAEDEIAAIGMVVGAGWAGARAMTSSSGPGISLMSEFAGLSYYAEVPAVVFDVQRIGPSTGLPTRTSQGDIFSTILNSHGDTEHLALIPGSMEECYSMAIAAFDLAERAQTLVFVLMDLDLGMNTWMSPVFPYPEKPIDRGKVLDAAKVKELGATWGRYKDVDGDGIPWRTIPGTEGPAYFTRGSGHNAMANYSERPDDYVANMDRLHKKFETAKHLVPAPIIQLAKDAKVGIIAFGSSHFAVEESRDQLKEETGLETSYLRLRAYPFPAEVEAFIRQHDRVYVIDQNRDGQMLKLLTMVGDSKLAPKLRSIRHYSGLPIDARGITDNLLAQERAK
jgi:2-oxoglutarate ferredoxin oxidoreductase subunit alpha